MHLITVGRDAEVLATIQAGVDDLRITAGAITVIGAVQTATVSVMHQDDALVDRLRHYDLPMELSGTGEIVNGRVHLHVTLYAETATFGGHLHAATVRDFFVRAYVAPLV
ncbi:PCC domain-containing protein [Actinoplanes xinjiangensis]|uniref:PPC domain-containing protein n=1 Tax=Actinoplanes xinjiangensis TaxID=512350 RepID=A0A316FHC8_9ACTN|nr:DUF296 domain-containing protein [Actinoplanes xinjiangensis]PWK47106.1 protein of unknown function (DUF296) [Actinoplanes xinjiangensis]GIF40264.1 hypothetical protein Axi01nite_45750 [Actinoplanes xinjiangensis]